MSIQSFSTGRALLDAQAILARTKLTVGMTYADLGAGMLGHFVFPAARMVGDTGRAYAVDILKSVLDSIASTAGMLSITNVIPVWGDIEREGGVGIASASADVVSMVNIAEAIVRTPVPAQEASRVLRPGGKLLVVGWDPKANIGPALQTKVSAQDASATLVRAGFRELEKFKAGPYHWGIIFER